MTGGDLRARILAFLAAHNTLVLASVGEGGAPSAAAVFYAEDEDLHLFFLSELRTEHGLNVVARPGVAGTIQNDGQDWRSIQGVQLRGQAFLVPPTGLAHATAIYVHKYAFAGALLAGNSSSGALAGPLARARFFVLRPHWIRLIDNSLGFGHKEELNLAAGDAATETGVAG